MPGGISGLFKNTRGAKMANFREKYESTAKMIAKRWNCSIERAYETIMKRIDKGLDPLPESFRNRNAKSIAAIDEMNDAAAHIETLEPGNLLENCIQNDIAGAVKASHYDLPRQVKETIELIEVIMERENIPAKARFMICQALRYIMRVGVETPDWGADIGKAENYLHRAITGSWNTGK